MRKKILISLLVVLAVCAVGWRSRYAPAIWRTVSGGIQYTGGNVNITNGTLTASGALTVGSIDGETITDDTIDDDSIDFGDVTLADLSLEVATDVYVEVKTVIKTIDADSDADADDFEFDDTAGNSNEQTIDMGAIIPAFAEVVSVQLRCFETFGDSNVVSIDLGISDGGAELLAAANIDTANDIDGTATGAGPKLESSNAARNVWINANPTGDWDKVAGISNTGRWSVIVTYIDYGAVHTAKSP